MRPVSVSVLLWVLACLVLGLAGLLTSGPVLAVPRTALAEATAPVSGSPTSVFCAEAIWCRMVQDLSGDTVTVTSVLASPQTDPHDFQVTPDTARQLVGADLVIMTGGHYDDWLMPLLGAQNNSGRELVNIASLFKLGSGDNPHIFDDPRAMHLAIDRVAQWLDKRFPQQHVNLDAARVRDESFCDDLIARLNALRPQVQGTAIAIAEPVGGPLFAALGLKVTDAEFALSTMVHSDPAPQDVARLEDDLRGRRVAAFIINPAMQTPALMRLAKLARQSGIPVVSLDEFPASDVAWKDWMTGRIDRLAGALNVHE